MCNDGHRTPSGLVDVMAHSVATGDHSFVTSVRILSDEKCRGSGGRQNLVGDTDGFLHVYEHNVRVAATGVPDGLEHVVEIAQPDRRTGPKGAGWQSLAIGTVGGIDLRHRAIINEWILRTV